MHVKLKSNIIINVATLDHFMNIVIIYISLNYENEISRGLKTSLVQKKVDGHM